MKKVSFIGLFLAALTFNACRKECKTYTYVPMTRLMQEYFVDNYKPGNYWIYLNRDSTKRDSMWVDGYKTARGGDKMFCIEWDETYFTIHTQYLHASEPLYIALKNDGLGMEANLFQIKDVKSQAYTNLMAHADSATFFMGYTPISFTADFQLNPTAVYPQVVQWGTIVYAPNIGIIQYTPVGTEDTFSLIKFHKP